MSQYKSRPSMTVTAFLMRYRILCLITVVLITLGAVSQLSSLRIDNSNESFFRGGDQTKVDLEQFKQTFGNDDFVFLLVETDNVFESATLSRLQSLADKLDAEVPHIHALTWIGNVESITGVPGGIVIDELIPQRALLEQALTSEQLKQLADKAIDDPSYRNRLISADGKTAGLLLEFSDYPQEATDPRKDIPPVIDSIVASFPDLSIHIVGGPIIDYYMDEKTAMEAPVWMVIGLSGMCLLLALTTRSLVGVLVPAITVVLSVIWTMALVAVLGYSLNMLVIMVPTLLLCVAIGDTMHVVAELKQAMLNGESREEALKSTLSNVSAPIALTTLTTSAGFAAFMATELVPLRELGIQAAMGVWVALLLTYIFAVPVLSFGSASKYSEKIKNNSDIFDRFLLLITDKVLSHPRLIGGVFIILISVSLYGLTLLKIETNTIQDLPHDDPVRMSFEYVDEHMGGSMSMELVIKTGVENGVKKLAFMQTVEKLQNYLDQHPLVNQTTSIIDQLKQMHRAVHENSPDYFRLPDSDAQIAEYLLLYETGGGRQLEQYVSFTYERTRLQIRTRALSFGQVRLLENEIKHYVENELPQLSVTTTGTLPMFRALADHIANGQAQSFVFAFCAILLIMTLVLKSIKFGLIAMLPNVLPVVFALGAMGLAGAEVNMVILVLAPMVLGVAVDDTIHFFVRYKNHFTRYKNYERAYRETMLTVGRPLLFTSLVLVAGFTGFMASDFKGPQSFSWGASLAFCSALLTDFMLAPILFGWLKPLGDVSEHSGGNNEIPTDCLSVSEKSI